MNEQNQSVCPVCNGVIGEGEQTVVCEKCNSVYHADCWNTNGGCMNPECKAEANTEIQVVENVQPVETVNCISCGNPLEKGSQFCPKCGANQSQPVQIEIKAKPIKKKFSVIIGAAVVLVAVIVGILLFVNRTIPVDALVVDQSELEIVEEDTFTLSCQVYPSNATDKNVIWTSSDEEVATVNEGGVISAVAEGKCKITATAGEKSVEIKVVVKKDVPDFSEVYDEYCSSDWAEVGSDKSYLKVDGNPYDWDDYNDDDALDAIEKINSALGLPDSLYSDMLNTTWSMGKQSETFENIGIKVEWTYHPDKGMEVTYKLING